MGRIIRCGEAMINMNPITVSVDSSSQLLMVSSRPYKL